VMRYDKLVRDRIPEIIAASGKHPQVRVLDDDAYAQALAAKLAEELQEYQQGGGLEELLDVVEVVQAIVEDQGMSWEEFERQRVVKQEERGGFAQRLLLEQTDP
jgi:predicted house-cleaning noncanonical NTP pyrophosphatase (MazG superfamily)